MTNPLCVRVMAYDLPGGPPLISPFREALRPRPHSFTFFFHVFSHILKRTARCILPLSHTTRNLFITYPLSPVPYISLPESSPLKSLSLLIFPLLCSLEKGFDLLVRPGCGAVCLSMWTCGVCTDKERVGCDKMPGAVVMHMGPRARERLTIGAVR